MLNNVYNRAMSELKTIFGRFNDLPSGNGARIQAAKRGKMTIYHQSIAAGNQAELAFDVQSFGERLGLTESDTRAFLSQLRATTGRPVEINAQYEWPRVGLATEEHVIKVIAAIKQRLPG